MIHVAPFLLGFILEAVWIVPVNTMLTLYCLRHKSAVWRYTGYAFFCSLTGALLGYCVGLFSTTLLIHFPRIATPVHHWISPISQASLLYQLGAIALGALLPIPFKLITIGAGILAIPIIPFLCAVATARFIRFFTIATAIWLWGDLVAKLLDRMGNLLIPFAIGISLMGLFLLRYM